MARFLSMALAAAALYAGAWALSFAPCWSLFLVVAALAWPIWHYQREFALFRRRALLAGLTREDSRARRWLWAGNLASIFQVFVALAWAGLLVGFAALLDRWGWLVLALDVLLLALVIGPVQRRLAPEVRFEQVDLVARRWPLTAVNLALLAAGMFALDFFFVGATDTRGLTWDAVAEQAFSNAAATVACPLAGALVGALAAVERLGWHAAQVLIPNLPQPWLKAAVWTAFLLQAGLLAYAFTRLALGAVALVDSRGRARGGPLPWTFGATIVAVALALLYASYALRGLDPARLTARARQVVEIANPCRADAQALAALQSGLARALEADRAAAKAEASAQVGRALDALFAEAEQGVDRYLDWHFSVAGEYQRLAWLATGDLAGRVAGELERQVFGDGVFGDRLQQASLEVARASEARMAAVARRVGARVDAGVRDSPCGRLFIDTSGLGNLERDVARASIAAGGGAVVGTVAVQVFARRAAAAAAARAASKESLKAGARTVGRTAAKRAGSVALSASGAAALCAPGGPLALFCGIVAGVAGWLAFDKAMIEIDAALFRDAMRADILAALAEQKAQLAAALEAQHHALIDGAAAAIGQSMDGVFVPVRHGL